ncbi:histidine kinase [Streptosporangium soli]|nr:histidine kinase [Streptosporangium sp. KLBMP 9127]
MTSEQTEATQGQLRTLNLNIVSASLSAVGALLVAIDAQTWWQAAVLGLGLIAAQVAVARWIAGSISRVALPCLIVTAAVWLLGVLVVDSATASYGISIVGTMVIHQLPRHRGAAALGLIAFVAAGLAARLLVSHGDVLGILLEYVLVSTGVAVVGVVLTSLNQRVSSLVAELEKAREREAELAVARERIRFASDLHDIQGHTLHVVKLKTALAQKLVRTDAGRAEEELREIHALVGDTITQTKELAYAQRRLNLSAELENAKNLLEAAGIDVRVDRKAEADTRAGELLGQVLRETTTNILRHAQAEQVRITLSESGITIVNDGAREDLLPELSGLATLRERVAGDGGELTVEQKDGRFLTAAAFPHLRSKTAL